jgi:hypothetical protein
VHPQLQGHAWAFNEGQKVGKDDLIVLSQDIDLKSPSTESTRKNDNLLRALACMAIKGYRYRKDDARSSVPAESSKDMSELGVSISDKTIRGWLQEGSKLLPNTLNAE